MTKLNINWRIKPFLLSPTGKDYLWGGSRLQTKFNKEIAMTPLAETWECSTHTDGPSFVASGMHQGKSLSQLLSEHPEYLGMHSKNKGSLLILIRFIDAKNNLSVQVHTNDDYAKKNEHGQLGKMEMWYVLGAKPGSQLIYGFNHDMTKECLRNNLLNGTIEKHLQKIKVKKDDVFFIKAGMVHAIGAGILIAEIQENSNLTYRLYDYNRKGMDGNPRPLHINKALDVANLKQSFKPQQPLKLLHYKKGGMSEKLCHCKYFQVERYILNTESVRELAKFPTSENSFQVFLCLDGCGILFMEDGDHLKIFKGDCFFIPANSIPLKFHGKARFLNVKC